jgi:hypothetical protein
MMDEALYQLHRFGFLTRSEDKWMWSRTNGGESGVANLIALSQTCIRNFNASELTGGIFLIIVNSGLTSTLVELSSF